MDFLSHQMKAHLEVDSWCQPKNPSAQHWRSLPSLAAFYTHLLFKRKFDCSSFHVADTGKAQENDHESLAPTPQRIQHFRAEMRNIRPSEKIPPALLLSTLNLLSEISGQTVGLTPSSSQLAAAFEIANGKLIQLAPGEGKTLAIAMSAVIFAWLNRPCHVFTANEYLAERDAASMQPFYAACGVRACSVTGKTAREALRACYEKEVVYATANQILADFLRDDILMRGASSHLERRLQLSQFTGTGNLPVSRGVFFGIVDEADSVLVDDAITPLIISHPEPDRSGLLEAIMTANRLREELSFPADYVHFVFPSGSIQFTDIGMIKLSAFSPHFSEYWRRANRLEDLFRLVISAHEHYLRDQSYIVEDDKVVIVEDSTGRSMPGRNWSHGVHQAVEAKEGVGLTPPSKTAARMTFQEYFRHYHILCGASGTLHGLDSEIWYTYGLKIVRVPPRKASRLGIRPWSVHATDKEKFEAVLDLVEALNEKKLPVLVGTRRIEDSERIAMALGARGMVCSVLNAKQHRHEAEIVAQAGVAGAITVATNMAGRGTDIVVDADVERRGGLQVILFEPHESARIDWQLFGRSGRQGAQGTAHPFVSLQDDVLRRFLPYPFSLIEKAAPPQTLLRAAMPMLLWIAQKRAQKYAARQRRQLSKLQKELQKQLSFARGR
jgi:preprotein translocase subunit SecA